MLDESIITELNAALRAAARAAIEDVGAEVVVRAKADLPVGDPEDDPAPFIRLRDSFHTEWVGDTYVISVSTPYAIKQHESFHLRHPRGGSPKFLERQFASVGVELDRDLSARVRTYVNALVKL